MIPTLCATGYVHTFVVLHDEIICFGSNSKGQLGLEHNNYIPRPIANPTLHKIKQLACGSYFTVCVNEEGSIWTFGENNKGQLGTGNTTNYNIPQKIPEIPPVLSVACGHEHTSIITIYSNLWSCGNNDYGQLCLGNKENQSKFQKTTFSNILKVSLGANHSLFQNEKGEIFSCGYNEYGECGLGHFDSPQITPSLIPNLPPKIIQFFCGFQHKLFLDSDGNVFSVGYNHQGQLGLGHNTHQNVLNQIPNIPRIQKISCVGYSSYLIDIEGNVWSFGNNAYGELGHGDTTERNVPTKIKSLKDIQEISCGYWGTHFLAKDSKNKIFAMGYNRYGQLGIESSNEVTLPKEINLNSSIMKNQWDRLSFEAKINWKDHEIEILEIIQSKIIPAIKCKLGENNDKIKQKFPQNSFESWNEAKFFLDEKLCQINSKLNQNQDIYFKLKKKLSN